MAGGPSAQSSRPKEYGTASSLLVVKHDVWFPDLLCRDSHDLHPLVVRGFPFQLVVIPDLTKGGGEKTREGMDELTTQNGSEGRWYSGVGRVVGS